MAFAGLGVSFRFLHVCDVISNVLMNKWGSILTAEAGVFSHSLSSTELYCLGVPFRRDKSGVDILYEITSDMDAL